MKSLERSLGAAQKRSTGVLSVFHRFVEELEGAADQAAYVAAEAAEKSDELLAIRADALTHAAEVRSQARKIKGLLQ